MYILSITGGLFAGYVIIGTKIGIIMIKSDPAGQKCEV
ncbi:hypothetical protein HMPREF9720_1044 [Alistipes sp. HGB5]|jgi:hypothetical protein|nr:hypothetical protein HMPREF9720_1044 [Alistipes sp. HGB5]